MTSFSLCTHKVKFLDIYKVNHMPRSRRGSIIYRPDKGHFEIRLSLGRDSEEKRVVERAYSPGPDTPEQRAAAECTLAKLILLRDRKHRLAELPRLSEWLEAYLASRSELRENTRTRMEVHRRHITARLGHLRLDEISPEDLEDFYRYLAAPKPQGKGLAKGTIIKVHQLLGSALRRALRRWPEALRQNPASLADLPHLPETERGQALPREHVEVLLAAARNHRLYALLYLTLALGLRRGEGLGVKWPDVRENPRNPDTPGHLIIRRAVVPTASDQRSVGPTKTSGSERILPLNREAWAVLQEHRGRMRAEGRDVVGGWVFPSAEGTPVMPRNFNRLFESWQIQAGLYEVVETIDDEGQARQKKVGLYRLHDLRVTSETEMIRATGNPKLVAAFHGQRSVVTAVKYYQKVAREDLEQAVAARRWQTKD